MFYKPLILLYEYLLLFTQDIPEDLRHVQRPQPSWEDDLVINEQKTVLKITWMKRCSGRTK